MGIWEPMSRGYRLLGEQVGADLQPPVHVLVPAEFDPVPDSVAIRHPQHGERVLNANRAGRAGGCLGTEPSRARGLGRPAARPACCVAGRLPSVAPPGSPGPARAGLWPRGGLRVDRRSPSYPSTSSFDSGGESCRDSRACADRPACLCLCSRSRLVHALTPRPAPMEGDGLRHRARGRVRLSRHMREISTAICVHAQRRARGRHRGEPARRRCGRAKNPRWSRARGRPHCPLNPPQPPQAPLCHAS